MVDASEPRSLSFRFQSHFDSQLRLSLVIPNLYSWHSIILSGYGSFNLSISDYLKTHSACMYNLEPENNYIHAEMHQTKGSTVELKDWLLLISVSHFSTVRYPWGGLSGLRLTSLLVSASYPYLLACKYSHPCSSPLRTFCRRDVYASTTCQIDDVNQCLNNLPCSCVSPNVK